MASPRPKPRLAAFRRLRHPTTGEAIDDGLVLEFPAPRSETGEDMAEFQVHGGRAVIEATLAAIAAVPGCRLAEPGEFARRAFENGKIDLTAAEGLADLVAAETDGQRRQALRQAGGALARIYGDWRERLIAAQALVEAVIDFSDEPDVAANAVETATLEVRKLVDEISRHLADGRRGEILRDGYQVVLAGPPNAGKSSLLNALARRDVAIVSEEAGTTRDVIEVRLDLGGVPVVIADTAGLREPGGPIEREGMRRTRERASAADLVIWLADAAASRTMSGPSAEAVDASRGAAETLVVLSKSDLLPPTSLDRLGRDWIAVSALTGAGIDHLAGVIAARAKARTDGGEAPALTRHRHRAQLEASLSALTRFEAGPKDPVELRAEDLRRAVQALGRITGAVDVEDVLDQVFGRFCLGK